jgi:hypothetical protein
MGKFYRSLKVEERKKLREAIEKARANQIRQRDILENSLMKAMRERIDLNSQLLKNEISIERYIKRSNYLSKYIISFFKYMGDKDGLP